MHRPALVQPIGRSLKPLAHTLAVGLQRKDRLSHSRSRAQCPGTQLPLFTQSTPRRKAHLHRALFPMSSLQANPIIIQLRNHSTRTQPIASFTIHPKGRPLRESVLRRLDNQRIG